MTHMKLFASHVRAGAITISVLFVGSLTITALTAQSKQMSTASPLAVQPFEDPSIDVAVYNRAFHSVYANLLSRPEYTHLATVAVVITNRSPEAVDGIVVRWEVPMQSGASQPNTLQVDRYDRPDKPHILLAGMQALVTPTGYITEHQVFTPFVTSALAPKPALADFYSATRIPTFIDSVIWEGGRVAGPDNFEIIDYIWARHTAARSIAERLRAQPHDDANGDSNTPESHCGGYEAPGCQSTSQPLDDAPSGDREGQA
jgi:hypothetical protein